MTTQQLNQEKDHVFIRMTDVYKTHTFKDFSDLFVSLCKVSSGKTGGKLTVNRIEGDIPTVKTFKLKSLSIDNDRIPGQPDIAYVENGFAFWMSSLTQVNEFVFQYDGQNMYFKITGLQLNHDASGQQPIEYIYEPLGFADRFLDIMDQAFGKMVDAGVEESKVKETESKEKKSVSEMLAILNGKQGAVNLSALGKLFFTDEGRTVALFDTPTLLRKDRFIVTDDKPGGALAVRDEWWYDEVDRSYKTVARGVEESRPTDTVHTVMFKPN